MIRHVVLIKFRDDVSDSDIDALFNEELNGFKERVDGISAVSWGRSDSPEKIERGYMHGFIVDFKDWDAHKAYNDDSKHAVFEEKVLALTVGGLDGVLVFDLPM